MVMAGAGTDGIDGTTGARQAITVAGTTVVMEVTAMVMPGALHMDIMVVTQEEILEDRTLPTIIQDEDTITGTMLIETVLQLL